MSNTCPICHNERDDIKQIPHWQPTGDVSSHRICTACEQWWIGNTNECPFCREVVFKQQLIDMMRNLIVNVRQQSSEVATFDNRAAVFEEWQMFEMQYNRSNPRVIYRVASIMVKDEEFQGLLEKALSHRSSWMRDAAGIFFRFHSLSLDGHLDVTDAEKLLLQRCYNNIIMNSLSEVRGEGHHYGALYSQAMAACACSVNCVAENTNNMKIIVREVGNLIVAMYNENKTDHPSLTTMIPDRIVPEYMNIVTDNNVWDSPTNDPVRNAFFPN